MKRLASIADTASSCCEGSEVLCCLRDSVTEHAHDNTASGLAVDSEVEENFLSDSVKRVLSKGGTNKGGEKAQNFFHFNITIQHPIYN